MVSREQILEEMDHVRRDLRAFKEAGDAIQRRSLELEDDPARQDRFVCWAVTQVVLNGLKLGIVKCEGLLEDYSKALEDNEPAQVISLVKEKS